MACTTAIGIYEGESWEKLCHTCMVIRHRHEYKEVDATQGDYGLDGFCKNGVIYQYYCPQNNYPSNVLYEKIREKVYTDINKLNEYKDEIHEILGEQIISSWVLVTPSLPKKDIINYCNKLTLKVRSWNLPFISPNFVITVTDYKYLVPEFSLALKANSNLVFGNISIPVPTVSEEKISIYKEDSRHDFYHHNAIRKHGLLTNGNERRILERTDLTIRNYLIGSQLVQRWSEDFQDQYEQYERVVAMLENEVRDLCTLSCTDNVKRYQEIKDLVEKAIQTEFNFLNFVVHASLRDFVIADWILRCPLDFE